MATKKPKYQFCVKSEIKKAFFICLFRLQLKLHWGCNCVKMYYL